MPDCPAVRGHPRCLGNGEAGWARSPVVTARPPRGNCPANLFMPDFPSVSSRRRCWPRPGPVRRERCCSKPVSRSPSSAAHGPPEVPVQIHGMDADELFAGEGDLQAARALVSRPRTPSCSSTPPTGTCSLTTVCRPTRSTLPRCLPNACSASSMASSSSGCGRLGWFSLDQCPPVHLDAMARW